jgi:lysozyme family protein
MSTKYEAIIENILKREGVFSNHPHDSQKTTKYGITQATLGESRHLGRCATYQEVFDLSLEEAKEIYANLYILKPGFHMIQNKPLQELVIDCGVHSGTGKAIQWLLEASALQSLKTPEDFDVLNGKNPHLIYNNLLARRLRFLGNIISKNHKLASFAGGWMKRCGEFLETNI